jgi:hypothetical protein
MRPRRIVGASGYARRSQCAICSGDQLGCSVASTTARSAGRRVSSAASGRRARRHAAAPASPARYCATPPFRATPRDAVDGARPSRAATARPDSPAASARDTSPRSAAVGWPPARRRGGSRRPPVRARKRRTCATPRPQCRAMGRSDSPARPRAQISSCSTAVNPPGTGPSIAHLRSSRQLPARWCADRLRPPWLKRLSRTRSRQAAD